MDKSINCCKCRIVARGQVERSFDASKVGKIYTGALYCDALLENITIDDFIKF